MQRASFLGDHMFPAAFALKIPGFRKQHVPDALYVDRELVSMLFE